MKSAKELTDSELTTWLTQEIEDLLRAGDVGLYEFLWSLNGSYPDLGKDRAITVATSTLQSLLAKGYSLAWFVWPNKTKEEKTTPKLVSQLSKESWNDPQDKEPYLAVIAN